MNVVEWRRRTKGRRVAHAFIHGVPVCNWVLLRPGSGFEMCENPPIGGHVCCSCLGKIPRSMLTPPSRPPEAKP